MENKPSYDELKSKCDDFQTQIIRFLKVEQDLIDTRSKLDRDLSRFKSIQRYSQKVILAKSLEEFADITIESVIETFEVECSAFYIYDRTKNVMDVKAFYGTGYVSEEEWRLDSDWISSKGFMKTGNILTEQVEPASKPFGILGLANIILSPFYDEDRNIHGMLLGAISSEKKVYYDEIDEESKPSFMVFTQQMSAMLQNFEAKMYLDMKVQERTAQVIKQKQEIEVINNELQQQKEILQKTLENLKMAQSQLVQSEKMASLGQLVSGIAHEINNPVNFISAGVESLSTNLEEIRQVLEIYHKITEGNVSEKLEEIEEIKEKVEYKEAIREINKLIESIKNGTNRTTEIIRGLRTFSRLDEDILKMADIHEGLDSTLILLHNKYGNRIKIVKNYGNIPLIECFPGQINQVFMNILSNSIEAIDDKGTITICTSVSGELLQVKVKDTGHGIPENLRKKIFDPFFTTKEVGKGTGLGLSISHGIIEKHKGSIFVNSENGKGTEFIISIPVNQTMK
jgi:signal transduction histidine kinase